MNFIVFVFIIIVSLGFIVGISELIKKNSNKKFFINNPREYISKNTIKEKITIVKFEDVPQGTYGTISINDLGLGIITLHKSKFVDFSEINSVSMQELNHIVKNNEFSLGKAVVGTALFGIVGGAVGGFSGRGNAILKGLSICYQDGNDKKYIIVSPKYDEKDKPTEIESKNDQLNDFARKIMVVIRNKTKK